MELAEDKEDSEAVMYAAGAVCSCVAVGVDLFDIKRHTHMMYNLLYEIKKIYITGIQV